MVTDGPELTEDQLPDERPQRRREYSGAASTLGVAVVVIAIVGFAIWWFEFRSPTGHSVSADALGIVDLPAAQNPTGQPPVSEVGRAAPNFRLANIDGSEAQLTDYRGRWVLLNFWASWCGPCRQETPELQALYEQHDTKLLVVGVNQQEPRDTAAEFASKYDVTYPILLDRDGEVSIAYRVSSGLPISMLVTPDGVIAKLFYGQVRASDLSELATEFLK